MSTPAEQAAVLLEEARQTGNRLVDLPSDIRPGSAEEAYAIQQAYAKRHGVRGWKVGQVKKGEKEPFCSILIGDSIHDSPAEFTLAGLSNAQAELEIGLTIGHGLAGKPGGYGVADILDAISSVHLACEILRSSFVKASDVSKLSQLADHQANLATVFAGGIEISPSMDLDHRNIRFVVDGKQSEEGPGAATFDKILESVAWLANHAASHGLGLKAGDRIITGGRIGPFSMNNVRTVEGIAKGFPPLMIRVR